MATTQNPVTGRMSGKFANAVFSTQYSQNIMKAKPLSVRNPQTTGQTTQRSLMSVAGSLAKRMNRFITMLFIASSIKMPALSYVVSWLLNNCLTWNGTAVVIDPLKLLPTQDIFGLQEIITMDRSTIDQVNFTWDQSLLIPIVGETCFIYGLLYDIDNDIFYRETTPLQPTDETLHFTVPGDNSAGNFQGFVLCARGGQGYKPAREFAPVFAND